MNAELDLMCSQSAKTVRIVMTSSRDPSVRVRQFLNELEISIPNSIKINRGRMSIDDIIVKALELGAKLVLYVACRRGNPHVVKFIRVNESGCEWLPYVIELASVKLLVDMPIRRAVKRRPRSGIIVMTDYHELADILMQTLELPVVSMRDIEPLRGKYESLIVVRPIRRDDASCEVQFVDGEDFGPRGPIVRVRNIVYLRSVKVRY